MATYIKGISAISPQRSFIGTMFEHELIPFTGNRMKCEEPDYSTLFDPKQIRRMSRIIRMAAAASVSALLDSGIDKPHAVIMGTSLGCLEDTETFLRTLVQQKEDLLSPTAFIYSTHNTLAAQVALLSGCQGYNSTYVHKNLSFESALLDAMLLHDEGIHSSILVGGVDELTDSSFAILSRLGFYKPSYSITDEMLYGQTSRGSIAGEGAVCFSLTDKGDPGCYAKIVGIETLSTGSPAEAASKALDMLRAQGMEQADLLVAGYNGDADDDKIFDLVVTRLNMHPQLLRYKHMCGEYATASAFAMWMAANILRMKVVPEVFGYNQLASDPINTVLVYNQYKGQHHSLILLSRADS